MSFILSFSVEIIGGLLAKEFHGDSGVETRRVKLESHYIDVFFEHPGVSICAFVTTPFEKKLAGVGRFSSVLSHKYCPLNRQSMPVLFDSQLRSKRV